MRRNQIFSALAVSMLMVASAEVSGQVETINFSFVTNGNSQSSTIYQACQSPVTITLETTSSNTAMPHGVPTSPPPISQAPANAVQVPFPAQTPTSAIRITISFSQPLSNPRLAITDFDHDVLNSANTLPPPDEVLTGFSAGFTGILQPFLNYSTPPNSTNGSITPTVNMNDQGFYLQWADCQDSISFIYKRPDDLALFLAQLDFDCACGVACTELEFYANTEANADDFSWEIREAASNTIVCIGGGYADNSTCQIESCCLPDGDYILEVFNASGLPFTGGYVLRSRDGGRIVDNPDGFSGASVLHGGTGEFSLPMGTARLNNLRCDLRTLYPDPNTDLRIEGGCGSMTGLIYWVFEPSGSGTWSFNRPGGLIGTTRLPVSQMLSAGLQFNTLYNVRVACITASGVQPFGPACTFELEPSATPTNALPCKPAHLIDDPGATGHSCDVFDPSTVCAPIIHGYRDYEFTWNRIDIPAGPFVVVRATNSQNDNRCMVTSGPANTLLWPYASDPPAIAGGEWMVTVRVKKPWAVNWCEAGPGQCCRVTFGPQFQGPSGQKSVELTDDKLPLVWPNPNSGGQLFLDLTWTTSRTVRVEVLDVFGRLVQVEQLAPQIEAPNMIQVRDRMTTGTYMVRIADGTEVRTTRLIIGQ